MRILSVDPGKITGVAEWQPSPSRHLGMLSAWEFPEEDVYRFFANYATSYDVIVVESYTVTARTSQLSQQLQALYVIGALRYIRTAWKLTPPLLRPPSDKRFATDAKLKALGMWNPSPGGHQNDACRHMLNYLVRDLRSEPHLEALKGLV